MFESMQAERSRQSIFSPGNEKEERKKEKQLVVYPKETKYRGVRGFVLQHHSETKAVNVFLWLGSTHSHTY